MRASVYNRDLAYISGYVDPNQLGAPGQALPDWQAHALGDMTGALLARRYGYQAAILVRVNDCGEIYARLAHDDDTNQPALRALSNEDYD